MKNFIQISLGFLILFVLFSQNLYAEEKVQKRVFIPTNNLRSEEELRIREKVSEALEDYLQKRKQGKEASSQEDSAPPIEIIYPPNKTASEETFSGEELPDKTFLIKKAIQSKKKPLSIPSAVSSEKSPAETSGSFELIVDGKKYRTLKEYKMDRLRLLLEESFFQADIQVGKFTDDELMDLLKSIRRNNKIAQKDTVVEMKRMMDIHNKKSRKDDALTVDLNKVKTIVIPSKE